MRAPSVLLPRARPGPRALVVILVVLLAAGGMWLWLRNSSLVSVDRVTVTGVSGPEAGAIRAALVTAARGMTTLHVDEAQFRAALAPYPEVKSFKVSAELPHGLLIRVFEQLAVAQVALGDRMEAVSADGTLLGSARTAGLPRIVLSVAPGGTRLNDPAALRAVEVLAAAPEALFRQVTQVRTEPGHGLVASLRNGPVIYLGDAGRLDAKWLAAAAVLAAPGAAGAAYIDVTDPGRPAAGAGAAVTAPGAGAAATAVSGPTSTTAGG